MKPLISYYGGKQRMASKILPLIPPHTVYVEPFAGGASLLFAKPEKSVSCNHDYREVLNDRNDLLVTMYRVARTQPDKLREILELTPYSHSEHRLAKQICKGPQDYSDLEIAWAVVVNCNQSFASGMNKGWGFSVCSKNSAATWNNHRSQFSTILHRLRDVYIESVDAIACIKRWDSPQSFFYCDPPYPESDQGHYKGYTQQDFENLVECLSTIQGSCLLSCYDNLAVPQEWERFEFEASMSAAKPDNSDKSKKGTRGGDRRTEVVWRKLSNHTPRTELSHLFKSEQLSLF